MRSIRIVVPLMIVFGVMGCGTGKLTTMPDVTGKKLDDAYAAIMNAGLDDKDKVKIEGGGTFGVVMESNWTVCAQSPAAGTDLTGQPRLRIDRSCRDDSGPLKKGGLTHRTLRSKNSIPYMVDIRRTPSLDKGVTVVDQQGRPGVRVRVLRVTLKNGVEVGRDVVNTFVKRQPVAQVKLIGTHVESRPAPKVSSNCNSNYAGACVPVASDVDCAGGSGDGPEYVDGPVEVVGEDVYDLNRDDDNIACDS